MDENTFAEFLHNVQQLSLLYESPEQWDSDIDDIINEYEYSDEEKKEMEEKGYKLYSEYLSNEYPGTYQRLKSDYLYDLTEETSEHVRWFFRNVDLENIIADYFRKFFRDSIISLAEDNFKLTSIASFVYWILCDDFQIYGISETTTTNKLTSIIADYIIIDFIKPDGSIDEGNFWDFCVFLSKVVLNFIEQYLF